MPKISLTDFVDVLIKAGSPKQTKVRDLKKRDGVKYEPAFDFWRALRKEIISFHSGGHTDKKRLDQVSRKLTDKKKITAYPEVLSAYKKWLGRRKFDWFEPPYQLWSDSGLDVRVNPELGLVLDDRRWAIKLYFKKDKLTPFKTQAILCLMQEALASHTYDDVVFAILDVRNSRLYEFKDAHLGVSPLLHSEATGFVALWNAL